MRAGSLRLRLLAGTLAWMLLAIAGVGWGLRTLFQDHVTQQLQAQLVMQLDLLSASVDWNPPGSVSVSPMAADPRLAQPFSGLYWQIDQLGAAPQAGVARSALTVGPGAAVARCTKVLSRQRLQRVAAARCTGPRTPCRGAQPCSCPKTMRPCCAWWWRATRPAGRTLQRFTHYAAHLPWACWRSVWRWPWPCNCSWRCDRCSSCAARLAAVRSGAAKQLEGSVPQELQPLVNEFNHVLRENADMVPARPHPG